MIREIKFLELIHSDLSRPEVFLDIIKKEVLCMYILIPHKLSPRLHDPLI